MPSILPQGLTQFLDVNGKPLAGGKIYTYVVGTTTPKTTWQDAAGTIPNANPIILDSGGRGIIWGTGQYRMQVYDSIGNLIWDQDTSESSIPAASSATEGQYLKVNSAGTAYQNVTIAQVQTDLGLPNPSSANKLDYLRVNAGGTAFEARTPTQVLGDIGAPNTSQIPGLLVLTPTKPTRGLSTIYINSTGRAIYVQVTLRTTGASGAAYAYCNGVIVFGFNVNGSDTPIGWLVPAGAAYLLNAPSGCVIISWVET